MSKLSPAVRCRSPHLRLTRIYRKIAKVEEDEKLPMNLLE